MVDEGQNEKVKDVELTDTMPASQPIPLPCSEIPNEQVSQLIPEMVPENYSAEVIPLPPSETNNI